jgi:hypothetical protein
VEWSTTGIDSDQTVWEVVVEPLTIIIAEA